MDLFAHYAIGMFLSKIFGTYWTIFFACILDIDHILYYYYMKYKNKESISTPKISNFVYSKRTWLHSLWGIAILLIIFSYRFSPLMIIVTVGSHLILDSIDKLGIEILPFLSKKKIKGPFPVFYHWGSPSLSNKKQSASIGIATTAIFIALFFFF